MNDVTGSKSLPPVLIEYKEELLAILLQVRGNSDWEPLTEQDWRNQVWSNVEIVAQAFLAREAEKPSKAKREATQDRLDDIAKALHQANRLLLRDLPHTTTLNNEFGPSYADLLRSWQQGELGVASSRDRNMPLLGDSEDRFRKAIEAVAILDRTANLAAKNSRGKRGGQRKHMDHLIFGLKDIYVHATGEKPGTGDGPFTQFVDLFLVTIGHQKSDVNALIKNSLPKKSIS